MPTLDWLNREAAFRTASAVPTRVLRPHAAGGRFGDGIELAVAGRASYVATRNLRDLTRAELVFPGLRCVSPEVFLNEGALP